MSFGINYHLNANMAGFSCTALGFICMHRRICTEQPILCGVATRNQQQGTMPSQAPVNCFKTMEPRCAHFTLLGAIAPTRT